VRQYATTQGPQHFATSRDNYHSVELRQFQQKAGLGKITILPLEVTDAASRNSLKNILDDTPPDLFINNAGVYGQKSLPLGKIDEKEWLHVLHVNTVAPLKLTELLQSNLAAAGDATIAVKSSKIDSIADNRKGGSYLYRLSKAAINIVVKCLAIDLAAEKNKSD
jgi:short-subunit dehydrogenase